MQNPNLVHMAMYYTCVFRFQVQPVLLPLRLRSLLAELADIPEPPDNDLHKKQRREWRHQGCDGRSEQTVQGVQEKPRLRPPGTMKAN